MYIRDRVDAVFHNNMKFNGDGVIVMIGDADAFAHRFPAQQMDKSIRHGAVSHAFNAETIGGSHAGDVGEHSTADGDLT